MCATNLSYHYIIISLRIGHLETKTNPIVTLYDYTMSSFRKRTEQLKELTDGMTDGGQK